MPDPKRAHDVSGLTSGDLARARRELTASLALVRPGSPARVPILAQMSAIETELAGRAPQAERRPVTTQAPRSTCARAASAPMTGSGSTAICSSTPAIMSGQPLGSSLLPGRGGATEEG